MTVDTAKILTEKLNKHWSELQYDSSLKFNMEDASYSNSVPEYTYTVSRGIHKIEFNVDNLPVRKDTDIVKILADIKDKFTFCTKWNFSVETTDIKDKIILILE